MKRFLSGVLLAGTLAVGLNAAPASNDWFEQWYKAKYGRPSPSEEARLKAERESAASREETRQIAAPGPSWIESHFKAKLGRNTPAEEARLKAEREAAAFREESARETAPAKTHFEEWFRAKYGRYPGKN
jgi:hypothetical protein